MYKVDPTLFEKFKSNLQTRANNNDPNPLVYITRNRTPITTQRFWEKLRVTSTVGTRSSIAVRRPEGNLTGDMIFVAQVESGNAVIRKAQPRINLTDMVWSHVTTLNNVSELSIMFDGYMKMVEGKVESYTTGDLPVVFYVDSDNSLKGWNMNTDVTFTISDTAYNVASVRGLYSEAADLNDGIFVFYTNASGELWEARVLNDEVTELTQITLKPDGVTGWEDVWASLTFDYRVVLQLKGTDGNIHTLMSYSRPSGYALLEYLALTKVKISGQIGERALTLLRIESVADAYGNYGKIVRLKFDGKVHYVSNQEKTRFRLINIYEKYVYPTNVTYGSNESEVYLHFTDINTFGANRLECFETIQMGSKDIHIGEFVRDVWLDGLQPCDTSHIELSSVDAVGEIVTAFDGKAYFDENTSYVGLSNTVIVNGNLYNLTFEKRYFDENTSYIALSDTVTVSGQYCNIDGIPL